MAHIFRGTTVMKSICAWCNRVMRQGTEPASHGICPSCARRVMESYEKKRQASSSASVGRQDPHGVPLMV